MGFGLNPGIPGAGDTELATEAKQDQTNTKLDTLIEFQATAYDKQYSYTSTTDVIEYQLASVTVKTKTITYTDSTKSVVDSVVWS